jgi:hypothetical protein
MKLSDIEICKLATQVADSCLAITMIVNADDTGDFSPRSEAIAAIDPHRAAARSAFIKIKVDGGMNWHRAYIESGDFVEDLIDALIVKKAD